MSGVFPLSLEPLLQLRQLETGEFESLGDDPQCSVFTPEGLEAIGPGWYRFRARVTLVDGEIMKPCLYPDWGDGLDEATRIDLPEPDERGLIDGVVVIKGTLNRLRFDPTIRRARFRIEGVSVQRIGRAQALLRMLGNIQRATRRLFWEDAIVAAWDLVVAARAGQLAAGADRMQRRCIELQRVAARGYAQWVNLFDAHDARRLEASRRRSEALPWKPRISIVLPVHNPPVPLLRKCIESVLGQTYGLWQLCIADDASSGAVRKVLREYAARDARISLHVRERHGHICEASNNALDMAIGNFVGFLDHDDMLAPEALAEVAAAVVAMPDARVIYTDEDKIDSADRRSDPNFKPAWNPDLLRSQNYICHFVAIETDLVREVGGLRRGFEGAQDHDLLLRCTERLAPDQVVHIPKVLYHWRMLPGSTALGAGQKSYASEAGRRAVQDHLGRMGVRAIVDVLPNGHYRPRRQHEGAWPLASIIIPTRDRASLLRACVASVLERTDYPEIELVIVDNGSSEPDALALLAELRADPRIQVVRHDAPFNFSELVNLGHASSRGEVLCLLNNDVEVIGGGWLRELVVNALRPDIGAVGCMLYYPDDTIQHAGVVLGVGGIAGHVFPRLPRGSDGYMGRARVSQNLSAVTGACMVVRRDVFTSLGGFDERLPVAFNDIDFCLRALRQGLRNFWTPQVELYHHESASRGLEDTPEKQQRFQAEHQLMLRRWGHVLESDPAYSPNLSLDNCHVELAFPPRPESNQPRLATWASSPGNPHDAIATSLTEPAQA